MYTLLEQDDTNFGDSGRKVFRHGGSAGSGRRTEQA